MISTYNILDVSKLSASNRGAITKKALLNNKKKKKTLKEANIL